MGDCQDNVFCVPVYHQAESACHGQGDDHSGKKQDQEAADEVVPVFCQDKPQTSLAKRKEETLYSGCLVSSPSKGHGDDKAAANEYDIADVR